MEVWVQPKTYVGLVLPLSSFPSSPPLFSFNVSWQPRTLSATPVRLSQSDTDAPLPFFSLQRPRLHARDAATRGGIRVEIRSFRQFAEREALGCGKACRADAVDRAGSTNRECEFSSDPSPPRRVVSSLRSFLPLPHFSPTTCSCQSYSVRPPTSLAFLSSSPCPPAPPLMLPLLLLLDLQFLSPSSRARLLPLTETTRWTSQVLGPSRTLSLVRSLVHSKEEVEVMGGGGGGGGGGRGRSSGEEREGEVAERQDGQGVALGAGQPRRLETSFSSSLHLEVRRPASLASTPSTVHLLTPPSYIPPSLAPAVVLAVEQKSKTASRPTSSTYASQTTLAHP